MTVPGRLTAHPLPAPGAAPEPGLAPLALGARRDGFVYVPGRRPPDGGLPLMLVLHGAGADASTILPPFTELAGALGVILVAPDSRGRTWDVILDEYGPDVAFIDRALARTFETCAVDPGRIAACGFSDGGSYALSLGLTNGGLFTHVAALSPGFMTPSREVDAPKFFVSHGAADPVLPVHRCSRRLVPMLERAGYDVLYREFDGGHVIPPGVLRETLDWFLA